MKKTIGFLIWLVACAKMGAGEPVTTFSSMEVNHLRVATPGLFDGRSSFTVCLDSIQEGAFCFPLPGGKLISAYGSRNGHAGHDIKTKANDTIRCVFDGVVRLSKPYAAYGNLIVVRHGNGLESVYSHQSRNLVKSGDVVKAGDAIGLTGRTGRATTEHLHFEFRVNGEHFNPDLIIDVKNHSLRKGEIVCTRSGNRVIVKAKQTP